MHSEISIGVILCVTLIAGIIAFFIIYSKKNGNNASNNSENQVEDNADL